jgi:PKD repeat protein
MTDRYVDPATGINTGAGGIGSPWDTLAYALSTSSATVAGDTIYLRNGNYDEYVQVGISGTAGNPITIKGYTGELATLRGVAATAGIINITDKSYLTFGENLRFSYNWTPPGGTGQKFNWITVRGTTPGGASNIILQDFEVERTGWTVKEDLAEDPRNETGIFFDDVEDCLVDNIWLRGLRRGVHFTDICQDCTMQFCDIGHTRFSPLVIAGGSDVKKGIVIWQNLLHDSAAEDGIQFAPEDGLTDTVKLSYKENQGVLVLYNQIYNNGENAIDLKGTSFILIEGNAIWGTVGSVDGWDPTHGNNRSSPGAIICGSNVYSERVIIRNNIFYDNQRTIAAFPDWKVYNKRDYTGAGSTAAKSVGVGQNRTSSPALGIRNNIFTGNLYDLELFCGTNQPGNEVDTDFNLYASGSWQDGTSNSVFTTLASWRNILNQTNWRYGKDANSIFVSGATAAARHAAVKFVDVSATPTGEQGDYDFALQSTSPAKGAGGYITLTNGAGTASTSVTVDDSTWFIPNSFGRTDFQPADRIFFAGQERTITAVNDTTKVLTISSAATWADNTPIYYVFPETTATTTPDMGAMGFLVAEGGGTPPPPTPGGPGGRASVRAAVNTSTGNQTFTFATPLSGTPIAWRFTITRATVDDTAADGAAIGRGWAWDNGSSIIEGAVTFRSSHNVGTSNSGRRSLSTACIAWTLDSASTLDGEASFVSGDTDGVTINWTNAPNAAYLLTVEAFVATDAYFGPFDIPQVVDTYTTVTCGFEPNYFEVMTDNRPIASGSTDLRLSHGFATRTVSTITQQAIMLRWRTGQSPTQTLAHVSNAYIGGSLLTDGSIDSAIQLGTVTSTTFRLTAKVTDHELADAEGFVFALLFDQEVYSGIVTTPTTPSATHDHAVGIEPGSADIIATTTTAVNSADSTGGAGAYGIGMWDGTLEFSSAIADQDNVGTTNTQSHTFAGIINIDEHDGTAGIVASVVGASGTNLRVDYSTVLASACEAILVVVGETFTGTVTAAFSGTPLSGEIPLAVVFTDASTDTDTTITTWAWDFGDGSTSTSQNPSHTYTVAGDYSVTLTVSDGTVSSTLVKTEYITASEVATTEETPVAYVMASSIVEPLQIASSVQASVEVIL